MKSTEQNTKILAVLAVVLGLALFVPSLAFAEFSRPYIGQITEAPGLFGEQAPFQNLYGLAVDPLNDDVFVGTEIIPPGQAFGTKVVDEFDSANVFMPPQISGIPIGSLAYDAQSMTLEGAVGEGSEYVAVDNSTGPAAGDVYIASGHGLIPQLGTVRRVDAKGEPAPFTCTAPHSEEYVKGGELTGRPGENGKSAETWEGSLNPVTGVAVDSGSGKSAGDVYVIYNHGNYTNPLEANQVDEFTPEGCFVRAITGVDVPEADAFGEALHGVAVDPTTGDVLVEAQDSAQNQVIDEFTEAGKFLGEITGSSGADPFSRPGYPGSGFIEGAIAVSSHGGLYVGVHDDHEVAEKELEEVKQGEKSGKAVGKYVVDEFGAGAFFPGAVTGEVSGARVGAVTLNGVVRGVANVEGKDLPLSECKFEYVTEEAFQKTGFEVLSSGGSAPCTPDLVGQKLEEKDYLVHAGIEGLQSGEVYRYRLVAGTKSGEPEYGGTQDGEVESFAAIAKPIVEDVSVGEVSSAFADFSARSDPRGSDTTYEFQYVDAAGYEAAVAAGAGDPYAGGGTVPVPEGDAGAGDRPVNVSVQAGGLSPDTSYDYRVVASNGAGGAESDGTFATVPAGLEGLPDGREYEMLTPPNKGSAEDMFGSVGIDGEVNLDVGYAAEDGDHFLLFSKAAFGPLPASGEGAYVFSRGQSGWTFKSVAAPGLGVQAAVNTVFDPADLSIVGVEDGVGHGGSTRMDLAGPPGGPYAAVASDTVSATGSQLEYPVVVGASEDVSSVLVESTNHGLALCESSRQAGAETLDAGSEAVYEWTAARGCLSLLDEKSQVEGGGLLSRCGAVLGRGDFQHFSGDMHGAVSADGSRVFFTAPDPTASGPECWTGAAHTPQLYMRVDGETTVPVSVPAVGVKPEKTYPAIYVGAAADGSRVFFMTRTQLTADAVAARTHSLELYEYDTQTGALARVSRGDSGDAEGDVDDVPAISPDGSTVYFNAQGELAPHPASAPSGGLYRYDTLTGQTAYVAPLQGYPGMNSIDSHGTEHIRDPWYLAEINDDLVPSLEVEAPYYTTADGEFLLFGPYRYDAADGSVVCVMCNPDGSGPIPDASFVRSAAWAVGNPAGLAPRGISENGQYVFFDTKESLVPQDTNGQLDVYEWHEDEGSAPHAGTISLISSGEDPAPSYVLDSSPDGSNVFFGTHAKLVPADTGSEGNLYDARIGGGFQESTGTRPCEGDACDNPPPAPIEQTPASLTFSGAGNLPGQSASESKPKVKPKPKCRKVKQKGREKTVCVKPKPKKKAKKSDHGRAGR